MAVRGAGRRRRRRRQRRNPEEAQEVIGESEGADTDHAGLAGLTADGGA